MKDRSFYSLYFSDYQFLLFIIVVIVISYWNAREGAFIWDDRAAIIANKDVLGVNPISSLFSHDFWGQDITLFDSHKSYRPFTVLTFRMDHNIYGLNAYGYHTTNIIVYILTCLSVHLLFSRWLNRGASRVATVIFATHPVHVEAVTSLVGRADCLCGLFYSLSIVCYDIALKFLSPTTPTHSKNTQIGYYLFLGLSLLSGWLASLSKEVGITVFPVLGVIELIYFLRREIANLKSFKLVRYRDLMHNAPAPLSSDHDAEKEAQYQWIEMYQPKKPNFFQQISFLITSLQSLLISIPSLIRISLLFLMIFFFFQFRISLHGETTVYHWTIMENHIDNIKDFTLTRILSYGQSHYWYFSKLISTKYLCFDYGYYCIPIIYDIVDIRNFLPLLTYVLFFCIIYYSIYQMKFSLFVGIAIFLFPLLPALNIFLPVGTLLAERLLFVPSIGFCMIIGELLVFDLGRYWKALDESTDNISQELEQKIDASLKEVYEFVNHKPSSEESDEEDDGNKEKEKEKGGKKHDHPASLSPTKKSVHFSFSNEKKKKKKSPNSNPLSPKNVNAAIPSNDFQSNKPASPQARVKFPLIIIFLLPLLYDSVTRIIRRNVDWKTELNIYSSALEVCPYSIKALANYAMLIAGKSDRYEESLQSALTAVKLYPDSPAAVINAGVAYQRLGHLLPSIETFEFATQFETTSGKGMGYVSSSLYSWISSLKNPTYKEYIRMVCLSWVDASLYQGFAPPSILHIGGTVAFEQGKFDLAIRYYEYAVKVNLENQALRKGSNDVPIEDDVNLPFTYNQIGNCYSSLKNYTEAINYYEKGLAIDPNSLPLIANAGIIYKEMRNYEKAKEMGLRGIELSGGQQPALLNNLGMIELELRNYREALKLFERAYEILQQQKQPNGNFVLKYGGVDMNYGVDAGTVEEVVAGNIIRAREGLATMIQP